MNVRNIRLAGTGEKSLYLAKNAQYSYYPKTTAMLLVFMQKALPLGLVFRLDFATVSAVKRRENKSKIRRINRRISSQPAVHFVSLNFSLKRLSRNGHNRIFLHEIVNISGHNELKTAFLDAKY